MWPPIWEAGSALRAEARGGEVTWKEAAARRAESCVGGGVSGV